MDKKSPQPDPEARRPLSVAWPPFAQHLADCLRSLDEDQYLILSLKRGNRFVQFAAQGAFGMRAETTSNDYLAESERLDASQLAALGAAGWRGPTGSPAESTPERDPDGSPNFFVEFQDPVPFEQVSELAVHTLAEILDVPHPGFLEYDAFDAEGHAILLPSLGLRHAGPPPRPKGRAALPQRLLTTIREAIGIPDLEYDDDGDIGVPYGSIAAFVRLEGNPPTVRIHCRLLAQLEETPELLSRLNAINRGLRHLHCFVHEGSVYAVADIPAKPFAGEVVASVFQYFCQIADGMDSLLQAELGGRTAFDEMLPSALRH